MEISYKIKVILDKTLSINQKRFLNKILRGNKLKLLSSLDKGFNLQNKILVGTHHKTGTVWLHTIFRDICAFHSLKYLKNELDCHIHEYDILFDGHSNFQFELLKEPHKGIHLIRDPRDIIVSATFYHQKSKEKWLHLPRQEFDGMTYQEKINSFSSFDDKMLFEMDNSAGKNIKDIKDWNYNNPNFIEVKYEDLIKDRNLKLFHKIFEFLGFKGKAIPSSLAIAYNNSLFSGKVDGKHVRSGKGKQYQKYFKNIHKKRFNELFGNILIDLGYEESENW